MSEFTAADVKRLRDLTAAGMMDCKKALDETDGDFDKAVELLRIKGAKDVGKRAVCIGDWHIHVRPEAVPIALGRVVWWLLQSRSGEPTVKKQAGQGDSGKT